MGDQMSDTIETLTVVGDGLTLPALVWRRFRKPMPGIVEAVYQMNAGLADLGPILPVGVSVKIPIPAPQKRELQDPIRLW